MIFNQININNDFKEENSETILEQMFKELFNPKKHEQYHLFCSRQEILRTVELWLETLGSKSKYVAINEVKKQLLNHRCGESQNPFLFKYIEK